LIKFQFVTSEKITAGTIRCVLYILDNDGNNDVTRSFMMAG